MQLRMILMVTLLSTLTISSHGKILKSLLTKKLSLLHPSVSKPTISAGSTVSVAPVRPPISFQNGPAPTVQADSTVLQEIAPLSQTVLTQEIHRIPAPVERYTYAPVEHRFPTEFQNTIYVAESRPVLRRTVYVEAQRNNLGPLPGIISNIPGIGGIVGNIYGLKSIIGNALRTPSTVPVAPVPARVTYEYVA